MMQYKVIFTPEALEQLTLLYRYIALAASPEIAERYTSAIVTYCEAMHTFPNRGTRRDDVRPGLRITNYKKRAVIAFAVDDEFTPFQSLPAHQRPQNGQAKQGLRIYFFHAMLLL